MTKYAPQDHRVIGPSVTVKQLRAVLEKLPDDDVLITNGVGNLAVERFVDGWWDQVGWIDIRDWSDDGSEELYNDCGPQDRVTVYDWTCGEGHTFSANRARCPVCYPADQPKAS